MKTIAEIQYGFGTWKIDVEVVGIVKRQILIVPYIIMAFF